MLTDLHDSNFLMLELKKKKNRKRREYNQGQARGPDQCKMNALIKKNNDLLTSIFFSSQ